MSNNPKIYFYIIFVMLIGMPVHSQSFLDNIRKLFSFGVSSSILDTVNEKIVGSLRAKNIRFVLPNKLELDDFEVLDEAGERVLFGQRVLATVSLLSLMSNNIVISDAFVEAPFFNYKIKNSIHNVVKIFESKVKAPSNKKSKLRVTIARVRVNRGRFIMEHDAGVKISATDIEASGNFWVENGPFGVDISQVSISQGSIHVRGMNLPITKLVAKNLWISDEKVSTSDLSAHYEHAKLTGNGTVFIAQDYYDISAHLSAPENTYPQGLKPLPFLPPTFNADVKLAGPLTDPQIQVQARTGSTSIRNLRVNESQISVGINKNRIVVDSSVFSIGSQGTIQAEGTYDIGKSNFSFESVQKNIESADLLQFLSLNIGSRGTIDARTSLRGSIGPKKPVFNITTVGHIREGSLDHITLGNRTNFELSADYVENTRVHVKRLKVSDDLGLRLSGSGLINLPKEGKFNYEIAGSSLRRYWPSLAHDLTAENFQSKGNIAWHDKSLSALGNFKSKKIGFRGHALNDAEFDFDLKDQILIIQRAFAHLHEGSLKADVTLRNLHDNPKIEGTTELDNVNLSDLAKSFIETNIQGRINATVGLSGSLQAPELRFSAQLSNLIIDKLVAPPAQLQGSFANDVISITRLSAASLLGNVMGDNLSLNLKSGRLNGSLYLADCNIAGWLSSYFAHVEGFISGPVHIGGTRASPHIIGPLNAKNIKFMGHQVGSGPLSVSIRREYLQSNSKIEDLVFSVSTLLEEKGARNSFQFAMGLSKQTINAQGEMLNFPFDTTTIPDVKLKTGIRGLLDAHISAQGYLKEISLSATITANQYTFFDPSVRGGGANAKKDHGPATIALKMENGLLDLNFVASLGEQKESLTLSLYGPCDLSSCDLELVGVLDHDHLEDVFLGLRKELASVSALASMNGKISKQEHDPWSFEGEIRINRLIASLPAIPRIELDKPVTISLGRHGLLFHNNASFSFSPGELQVGGSFSEQAIDLDLKGAIPLILLRLVAPIVQRANGLARGQLKISGSLAAPVFDGHVAPEPGAEVTFNKWFESLEVKEGAIVFEKTSPSSFRSEFRAIKLGLGDGRLSIDGSIDKNQSIFDLQIEGSNIVLKNQGQYIEADLNCRTVKDAQGVSVLKGTVVVTDGHVHRQFDLRNFEALALNSQNQATPQFIESLSMNIDLDIAIRHFTASARMLNIDIDTILTGQLKAQGPLNLPKFSGNLAVSEGKITFPATTFDLYESRIDLDEHAERGFNPRISITTSQDFEKDEYPLLQRDTTVQLSLTGDLDRLKMELRPISGDMKLSQTKIFLMLLMPRSLSSDPNEGIRQSAQNAAMAFSGEVFLRPLTNELTELLEGKTKTRFQIGSALEPGGISLRMNWKIGPRIEAQGSYMYIDENYRRVSSEHKSFLTDQYPLGDIKLKLMLFDHKPFGPLFFESSFGANRLREGAYEPRGVFRLSYRILSK